MLNLSNLKPAKGSVKNKKRIGRGGKRGSYSGRGMKGQKARSGGKGGLKALGFKQTLQRVPKSRGFNSLKAKLSGVNLLDLEKHFNNDEKVNAAKLIRRGLVKRVNNGVKILGNGQLNKKLIVSAHAFSESAKQAIIKAGGEVILIGPKKEEPAPKKVDKK